MKVHDEPAGERDALLKALAAELASAAYRIALRHGVRAAWLDLELDLWRALTEAVEKWDSTERPDRPGFSDGAAVPRSPPEDAPPHIVRPHPLSEDGAHLVGGG